MDDLSLPDSASATEAESVLDRPTAGDLGGSADDTAADDPDFAAPASAGDDGAEATVRRPRSPQPGTAAERAAARRARLRAKNDGGES
ncbi:MAG: hypothetical protein JO147_00165 [Actinobacteria bacterium]|nr:hypothetical protein [Actinomycetota bacterium]